MGRQSYSAHPHFANLERKVRLMRQADVNVIFITETEIRTTALSAAHEVCNSEVRMAPTPLEMTSTSGGLG